MAGYNTAKLPVWIDGNIYYNQAKPYKNEKNYIESSKFIPEFKIVEEGNNVFLYFSKDNEDTNLKTQFVTTELLGKAKMPNEAFENPDGTPLKIDTDYFDKKRSDSNPSSGPFENSGRGVLKLKVW